jgi:hypothetical protein
MPGRDLAKREFATRVAKSLEVGLNPEVLGMRNWGGREHNPRRQEIGKSRQGAENVSAKRRKRWQ